MGSNLLLTSISDIALEMGDAPFGSNLKNSDYTDDGVLVVQGRNVTGRTFTWSNNRYVSLEKYNSIPRSHCFVGDLIFPKVGTIGKVGRLSACEGYDKYILSTNTMRLRVDPKKANPLFVYYYFTWTKTVNLIQAMNSKSVQPVFNFTTLKKFPIGLPPRRSQDFSAKILDSIDNKIELNQKTNQTLEQIAQALFKSWFVDFDPVFDNLLASVDFNLENLETSLPNELKQKAQRRLAALDSLENAAECKASLSALAHELQAQTQAAEQVSEKTAETPVKANLNANPKILTQHANTHAHFSNEFEHNEQLGWIPKGWDIKAVSETIQINPRTSLSKGAIAKFADMKSIPTSGYMVDEIIEKAFSGGVKFKRNDILLARITPCLQNGKTAWVDFLKEDEVGFGSTEFIVLRENNNISFPFIACLAKGDSFRAHCMQSMVGSSGRQRVQNACFDSYYLALPKSDVLKDMFTELTKPNFKKMTNNKLESESLTKIRDTLLPKLISGELQIPDVATDDETVD